MTVPHQRTAALCLFQGMQLNDWERGFLRGIKDKRRITPKQQETLSGIVAKIDFKMKQREPSTSKEGQHAGY
jgi:hypothetical protein